MMLVKTIKQTELHFYDSLLHSFPYRGKGRHWWARALWEIGQVRANWTPRVPWHEGNQGQHGFPRRSL